MSNDGFAERDKDTMELKISRFLRMGVITSAGVILIGLIMLLLSGKSGYPGENFPTTFTAIVRGLILLKPYAVILIGLLLLIFTPIFRVMVSILFFMRERDYLYVVITSVVFMILAGGLLLGKIV